jgi:serine/threonine protein kinase
MDGRTHISLHAGVEIVPGYRLVRRLGEGGFGEVWEALAPGDFSVALKFIRLDTSKVRPEFRSLQILRTIRHPHLLDIQWAVERADRLVVAMPLCDQSLRDRFLECIGRQLPGIPRAELMEYMQQVAGAIDFLNEPQHVMGDGKPFGVQHRDIKPHNIFLVGGSARVADFGLAKIVDESGAEHSGPLTPSYAPPEFFRSIVAPTSDQYSLAVTYTHLRGGHLPFTGTLQQIMHGILNNPPNLQHLPREEQPIVERALSKDPSKRWSCCREFVNQLSGSRSTPALPRTNVLRALALDVRGKTLQLLEVTSPRRMQWVPPGTSNHILWHAGHALWVQDALCVRLLTGRSELPPGWEEMFGMGSQPAARRSGWPAREELRQRLSDQLPRLLKLIDSINDADLDALPRHAYPGDSRTLGQSVLHAWHDEANHQGEMYLLFKMQKLNPAPK